MAASPTPPPSTLPEIDRLRAAVAAQFPVYETRSTPRSLVLLVHADPATLEEPFDRLRQQLWDVGFIPQIRRESGEYVIEIVRRPRRAPWAPWTNLLLLAVTIVSTIAAGAFLWLAWRGGNQLAPSDWFWGAIYFAAPLLVILGLHELAHFVTARHHHVEASLPYFLPVPPPFLLFGTFGAFISLREPIPSRKALLDIGASGPLAGFAVALPVTIGGLFLSAHTAPLPVSVCGPTILGVSYGNLAFGPSLIWSAIGLFVPPAAFENLQPLAIAGWVGILVTAINLLPAGQLDGGHVFRALFGERTRWVSYIAFVVLIFVGIAFQYLGWILFGVLIFALGLRHPPPLNDLSPLDGRRWAVGALAVGVLIGGFVLVPIAEPTQSFSVSHGAVDQVAIPAGQAMADSLELSVSDHDFVPHGYRLNGSVLAVYQPGPNGSALYGSALASFLSNSTWIVDLPGSSPVTFGSNGSLGTTLGAFQMPADTYLTLPGGATSAMPITVEYLNHQNAVVEFDLTVTQLCGNRPSITTGVLTAI